ncbi:MAG: hypothetical protein E4G94_11810 [ANME-2 cluster archaeon]|nr:MAG: hypothetical protein E4G94_11810 [ANME-2 cluster archaeon]
MKNLDYQRSIWIHPNELGMDKIIDHNNRKIKFKVPQEIDDKVIFRFRGLGKIEDKETGDLLVNLWLITPGDTISTKKSYYKIKESIGNLRTSYFSSINFFEFIGFLLIIIGSLLVIGNLTGIFPISLFAGFFIISIGLSVERYWSKKYSKGFIKIKIEKIVFIAFWFWIVSILVFFSNLLFNFPGDIFEIIFAIPILVIFTLLLFKKINDFLIRKYLKIKQFNCSHIWKDTSNSFSVCNKCGKVERINRHMK